MKCIFCGYHESKVVDSRTTDETNSIRRRRECLNCGKRFTTYETVEKNEIQVVKADNSRQPFDINKLKKGLTKACEKRPVSLEQINNIIRDIENDVASFAKNEISSKEIGELVMKKLRKVDEIAYIRFALVFYKFNNIELLLKFLHNI